MSRVKVTGTVGFDGRRWVWSAKGVSVPEPVGLPWVSIDLTGMTRSGRARTESRAERRCRRAMRRLQRLGERRSGPPATVRAVFLEDDG